MDEFQAQMFDIFVFETQSFLNQLEQMLMQIESGEADIFASVDEIFRIMHTVKSSSAMMGFTQMSTLAHRMEDLFQYIRDESPAQVDEGRLVQQLLGCVDYFKLHLEPEGHQEQGDSKRLVGEVSDYLTWLKEGGILEEPCTVQVQFAPDCDLPGLRVFELICKLENIESPAAVYPVAEAADADTILRRDGLYLTFASLGAQERAMPYIKGFPYVAQVTSSVGSDSQKTESEQEKEVKEEEVVPEIVKAEAPAEDVKSQRRRDPTRQNTGMMGVKIKSLDQMVNLAGELIIASMGAGHQAKNGDLTAIRQELEQLHKLVLSIQETALTLRMVTVADTFHTLKRSLRDMTAKLDKEIDFTMSGEELSMDKDVIQQLHGPLLHILKNSVDHGIELPAERRAAGKPETGKIHLSAQMVGKYAVISAADDGRGLHHEKILAKAVESGFLTEDQARYMPEEEVAGLIFQPGFSTKEEVSEYSGRGVGMDAVHETLEKISGSVEVTSKAGEGTTISLHVPLSLVTMDAMVVLAGGERYVIPVNLIEEVFRPEPELVRVINGEDTVMFRDVCYPLRCVTPAEPGGDYSQGTVILIKSPRSRFGLYVDKIIDYQNVVVKSVPGVLKGLHGIQGCTILGDGRVSLIIDNTIQTAPEKGGMQNDQF